MVQKVAGVTGLSFVCCLVIRGLTGGFLLLRYFSSIVSHPGVLQVSQNVPVESSSLTHHRPHSCFVWIKCFEQLQKLRVWIQKKLV